jgi:hypothetical protein
VVDKKLFTQLLSEMAEYYGRKLPPAILQVWYTTIAALMSNAEFQKAFEQIIFSEQYMPTPEKFLEMVKGSSDALAHSDWELCVQAAARADREMLSDLSPQGKSALYLIGGLHKLGQAEVDRLPWIKKEFISLWKSAKIDTKSLLAAKDSQAPMLSEIVDAANSKGMNGKHHQ